MKEIIDFLKECPAFSGVELREDFLSARSGSAAIVPDGGKQLLRRYTSGDLLGQYNFKLLVRENFTGQANRVFGMFSEWIDKGNLPDLSGDKTAQYIEITEGPALIKTETGAGIYDMKFTLVYYEKGVKNE